MIVSLFFAPETISGRHQKGTMYHMSDIFSVMIFDKETNDKYQEKEHGGT